MHPYELFSLFTLGFTSLFPLVNPIGTALIINPFLSNIPFTDKKSHIITICFYSFTLGLSALLLGSWCLRFMGISIPTTQLAGGLVIAHMGLNMLNQKNSPDDNGERPTKLTDSLFFPLAFPLTVGPGTVSVLITLSAHAHNGPISQVFLRMGVLAASFFAVMTVTYFCFMYSDVVIRRIGPQGSLVMNRLMAFLVFCIGLQLAITGVTHSFPNLFH